jgi:hypothetical protein
VERDFVPGRRPYPSPAWAGGLDADLQGDHAALLALTPRENERWKAEVYWSESFWLTSLWKNPDPMRFGRQFRRAPASLRASGGKLRQPW